VVRLWPGQVPSGTLTVMVARTLALVIVQRLWPGWRRSRSGCSRASRSRCGRFPRPRYAPQDRLVLSMLARLLSRERWAAFLVGLRRCCGGIGSWRYVGGRTRLSGDVDAACQVRW